MDNNMLRRALWVFLRPLIQLISNLLNPEIGEEWLEELKKFLRKEPCWVEKDEQKERRLISLAPITITLTQDHNPNEFYQTRPGLWVSGNFRTRVVDKAKPSKAGTTFKLNRVELAKDLTNSEIEAALPQDHFFDESQVCAIVDNLVSRPGDEKNEYYLLYTASRVVSVDWYAGNRKWSVSTWTRDDDRWSAVSQVFSPTTDN